ncbi:MAG TPA: TIGR04282 family arsenosugar biosynthesis glycosyltransferase [Thermoanaerobaculia bacterium]|jgi:rSAM/selenodomain-associated transferase 1|nr:TIGR04282 family arsenosugar biosynthesis glycosyltransferase [Thermoanaerobaculia bacterium]
MFATVPPPPLRLLVFARLPELGKVKTRLAAELGDERALEVYTTMLRNVLGGIGTSSPELEIEVMWPPTPSANGEALRSAFAPHATAMQTGSGLGDRMSMAMSERFFFHRTEKIVIIGVDDPSITRELIDHAFALLESCEYVLGPASDGGYYLIGARALSYDPSVFQDIEWGTSTVLAATLARVATLGRTVALLPEHYDIDTASDLQRYLAEGQVAP